MLFDGCLNAPLVAGGSPPFVPLAREITMKPLLLGGIGCVLAALLHVAIIFGGPEWYRFFGAGEHAAQQAAAGEISIGLLTAGIAAVLLLWGVYAIAVARGVRRLPLAKTVLGIVAAIFLLRGLLGLPAVLWSHGAEAEALRLRMGFVVSTSAIALVLGLCYLHGVRQLWRETSDTKAR